MRSVIVKRLALMPVSTQDNFPTNRNGPECSFSVGSPERNRCHDDKGNFPIDPFSVGKLSVVIPHALSWEYLIILENASFCMLIRNRFWNLFQLSGKLENLS